VGRKFAHAVFIPGAADINYNVTKFNNLLVIITNCIVQLTTF